MMKTRLLITIGIIMFGTMFLSANAQYMGDKLPKGPGECIGGWGMCPEQQLTQRLENDQKNVFFVLAIGIPFLVLIGFSRVTSFITGEPIKPFAAYQNPAKLAVSEEFMDYNDSTQKYKGSQYWETIWDTMEKYLDHNDSKFDGDIGVLQQKYVEVSDIAHIGKESNELDESELDYERYEIYENKDEIERKFKELIPLILKLEPKHIRKFGISRQTLWNVKKYLQEGCLNKISLKVKMNFLNCFV